MPASFCLNLHTSIWSTRPASHPVQNAAEILKRDMQKVLKPSATGPQNLIVLQLDAQLDAETFSLRFESETEETARLIVSGADELGLIYGLLFISEKYLGVPPFWFWNDTELKTMDSVSIPTKPYRSRPCRVRYRGWFVNDEMLLLGWKKDDRYAKETWQPVFEALLRCGGNMVVPGTGETNRHLEQLAADMGLILTHHHAEALGAELFLSAYPDQDPSYQQNAPLFEKLWGKAILRQKDKKVVWALGFRGQGDRPFWEDDPAYATPQARGELIGNIIKRQYDLLCRYIDQPVCCTNLYGEIMQLYRDGWLSLPEGVIKVWADSGYGKMVSRRQGNLNPRIPSLPCEQDQSPHGLYYHVAFHDLQASNQLTMEPNSPKMIIRELQAAFEAGADHYLILNCGSVKPHIYMLDLVAKLWRDGTAEAQTHLHQYVHTYFTSGDQPIEQSYQRYFQAVLQYGAHADEHAGEQLYHYPARNIISHWLHGDSTESMEMLTWATGSIPFVEQVKWFARRYAEGRDNWDPAYQYCVSVQEELSGRDRQLFDDNVVLQTLLHLSGCEGGVAVCRSFLAWNEKNYLHAYLYANMAMQSYQKGLHAMKAAEHDCWVGFYFNDCLTNVKLTVYFIDTLRRYLRIVGDGTECLDWERTYLLPESLRRVMLETTYTNQLTDDELYEGLEKLLIHAD